MRNILYIMALMIVCLTSSITAYAIDLVKHGGASATQTLKPGEKLGSFFYTFGPVDCDIKVTNLAPGICYKIDRKYSADSARIDIYGVASDEIGKYKFRIEASKGGESAKPRTGTITIVGDLIYARNTEDLCQTIEEGDSIKEVDVSFANGLVKIEKSKMVDGLNFVIDEESQTAKIVGSPTKLGKSSVVIFAESNGVKDTLTLNLNVLKDGLLVAEGSGTSKQVVYLEEDIVPITIKWECNGQLKLDYSTNGIDIDVDKENRQIKIYGAPRSLGHHTISVEFETKHSVTSYKIDVMALADTYPSFYVVSNDNTLNQVVPYRSMIDSIMIEVQDADSISVIGLPEGIQSKYDEESSQLIIYGTLREDAAFEIKVEAYNKEKMQDILIHISSLNGGSITSLVNVLAQRNVKIEKIELVNIGGSVLKSMSPDEINYNDLPQSTVSLVVIYTDKGIIVNKILK